MKSAYLTEDQVLSSITLKGFCLLPAVNCLLLGEFGLANVPEETRGGKGVPRPRQKTQPHYYIYKTPIRREDALCAFGDTDTAYLPARYSTPSTYLREVTEEKEEITTTVYSYRPRGGMLISGVAECEHFSFKDAIVQEDKELLATPGLLYSKAHPTFTVVYNEFIADNTITLLREDEEIVNILEIL